MVLGCFCWLLACSQVLLKGFKRFLWCFWVILRDFIFLGFSLPYAFFSLAKMTKNGQKIDFFQIFKGCPKHPKNVFPAQKNMKIVTTSAPGSV